jgi:hypothetical protein
VLCVLLYVRSIGSVSNPQSFSRGLLTKYPVALEAVLRAKVALFPNLLASRTLQGTSVILAIFA